MSFRAFRDLHRGPELLLLPNAWDAGSARLIESVGARAIATTSAGVAWSRGYPDGGSLPGDQLINATRDMARVIRVPLTVDIEGGYSNDSCTVADLVARLLSEGIAGINIEDGSGSVDLLCEKIAGIRDNTLRSGTEVFINVRTDVYLRAIVSPEAALEECVRRGARYGAAGADGLFIPGLKIPEEIASIVKAIAPMPLNVMAVPDLPSIGELQKLGVRRLSAGSSLAQAAMGCVNRLASQFQAGNMRELFEGAAGYGGLNALFA